MLQNEEMTSPRYWGAAVQALIDINIRVEYVITRDFAAESERDRLPCPTHSLGCESSKDYPQGVRRLRKLLKERRIDVLHTNEPIQGAIGSLACRVGRGTSCLYHRHHAHSEGLGKGISRLAALGSHRTMAVSQAALADARRNDIFNKNKIDIVHNGVPEPREVTERESRALRQSIGIPAHESIVVAVARLRPEKGIDSLIEAMSHLAGSLKQRVHLVIVGDGSERQKLAELAKSRAASIVHFVGSTEDVAPWYSLADVVAVSSTREAFGLTAIEAMASARPVVATKVGGLPEIVVQGETGLLVPSLDSMAMAKALAALIADKPRARLQGVAGRSRYQSQFATRRMVEGWAQVYERLQRDRGD